MVIPSGTLSINKHASIVFVHIITVEMNQFSGTVEMYQISGTVEMYQFSGWKKIKPSFILIFSFSLYGHLKCNYCEKAQEIGT